MKVGSNHESNLNRLASGDTTWNKLPTGSNGQWESILKPFEKEYERYAIEYIEQAVPPDMFITFCLERSSSTFNGRGQHCKFSSFTSLLGQKNISFLYSNQH